MAMDRIKAAAEAFSRKKEAWASDLSNSGAPSARQRDIDLVAQRKKPQIIPLSEEELDFHAEMVGELLVNGTQRKVAKYLRDRGFSESDQKKIIEAARLLIQREASYTKDIAREISIARHEAIIEKSLSLQVPELKVALEAQRGLDGLAGIDNRSDEVSDIRDGFIAAMRDVFKTDKT